MCIVAVSMVFTSCKDDEEEPEQQTEQLAFSFTLEGMTSWEPKGILAAYDSYDVVPLIEAYASKNMTLSEMMAYFTEETEASSLPADLVMIGTIAEIGTHTATGNFITSDSGETAAAYITGQTDLGDGFIIPTGWVSETMTATITKLDLT